MASSAHGNAPEAMGQLMLALGHGELFGEQNRLTSLVLRTDSELSEICITIFVALSHSNYLLAQALST